MTASKGIGPYLKQAREKAGLSRREAGTKLALHPKSIEAYEYGRVVPPPEVVMAMGELYGAPELSARYCRLHCAIGAAFGYEILNNVDLGIPGILLKLQQEFREAEEALAKMSSLCVNKRRREDFREHEVRELGESLHRLLNLEHNIEVLKLQLAGLKWLDLRRLISEHNTKCYYRGYVVGTYAHREEEKDLYRRGDESVGAQVKESFGLYWQKPGFPRLADSAEIH